MCFSLDVSFDAEEKKSIMFYNRQYTNIEFNSNNVSDITITSCNRLEEISYLVTQGFSIRVADCRMLMYFSSKVDDFTQYTDVVNLCGGLNFLHKIFISNSRRVVLDTGFIATLNTFSLKNIGRVDNLRLNYYPNLLTIYLVNCVIPTLIYHLDCVKILHIEDCTIEDIKIHNENKLTDITVKGTEFNSFIIDKPLPDLETLNIQKTDGVFPALPLVEYSEKRLDMYLYSDTIYDKYYKTFIKENNVKVHLDKIICEDIDIIHFSI